MKKFLALAVGVAIAYELTHVPHDGGSAMSHFINMLINPTAIDMFVFNHAHGRIHFTPVTWGLYKGAHIILTEIIATDTIITPVVIAAIGVGFWAMVAGHYPG